MQLWYYFQMMHEALPPSYSPLYDTVSSLSIMAQATGRPVHEQLLFKYNAHDYLWIFMHNRIQD